jgi:UDPglucose 6-dehydrogenase
MATHVQNADVVFIAVGTPSRRGEGEADLSYVEDAARNFAPHLKQGAVVVIKSTVVVGTCRWIKELIHAESPDLDFSCVPTRNFCAKERPLKTS